MNNTKLMAKVAEIYDWLDQQIKAAPKSAGSCKVCGKCCDFKKYEHRLFVTTLEIMYLKEKLATKKLRPMITGKCPYSEDGKCVIYEYRFAGCRIFCCNGDNDFQSKLSEAVSKKIRFVYDNFKIPYCYVALDVILNSSAN